MLETFLVPEETVVSANGEGVAVDVRNSEGRVFLLTLTITVVIEQEALDISIYGSVDGNTWEAKPLASFPQKFYREEAPLLLNLTDRPDVRFIRAHWQVNRWGRGRLVPMFEFTLKLQEVPAEILAEASSRVKLR